MTPTTAQDHAFKVEYMQPFVDSLHILFTEHMNSSLKLGRIRRNPEGRPRFGISGVVTFTGTVIGRAVLSFPEDVAIRVCQDYLKADPLPADILADCVGEISNVVVGRAKSELTKFRIRLSPPTVIRGTDFEVAPQPGAMVLSIPAECIHGYLQLDLSLVANRHEYAAYAALDEDVTDKETTNPPDNTQPQ